MNAFLFERDYGTDYFDFDRQYRDQLDPSHPNFSQKLVLIQEEIIASNNAAFACFLAVEIEQERYRMQKVVLSANCPKYLFFFAQHIKGADIVALQKALFNNQHKDRLKYLCQFACYIPGANIYKIEALILQEVSKNKKLIHLAHLFLKNVKTANFLKFKTIILSSKKPRYLFALAKKLNSKKEIGRIEDMLIEQQSFLYIRLMAQQIKTANVEKLEQAILNSGNMKEIKKFAKSVKRCKSKSLAILF